MTPHCPKIYVKSKQAYRFLGGARFFRHSLSRLSGTHVMPYVHASAGNPTLGAWRGRGSSGVLPSVVLPRRFVVSAQPVNIYRPNRPDGIGVWGCMCQSKCAKTHAAGRNLIGRRGVPRLGPDMSTFQPCILGRYGNSTCGAHLRVG
jgi:hypothetical protein